MNRHQLEELAVAHALYEQHLAHRTRLIEALNAGRLQGRPLSLFSPGPRLRAVKTSRSSRASRSARTTPPRRDRLAKVA
ncbi:MAG: hypothetical protein AB7L76_01565 [Burkholderiaceae bacterium]